MGLPRWQQPGQCPRRETLSHPCPVDHGPSSSRPPGYLPPTTTSTTFRSTCWLAVSRVRESNAWTFFPRRGGFKVWSESSAYPECGLRHASYCSPWERPHQGAPVLPPLSPAPAPVSPGPSPPGSSSPSVGPPRPQTRRSWESFSVPMLPRPSLVPAPTSLTPGPGLSPPLPTAPAELPGKLRPQWLDSRRRLWLL